MGLKEFSAIVLKRRRELDLTQEQVAQRVRVHANYIGYLERGLRRPGDRTLLALSKALDLDKAALFATLNPLFRDIVRIDPADVADDTPLPEALRGLMADEHLLAELGATPEQVESLRFLGCFGEISDREGYLRLLRCIVEITEEGD